jgi:hypothetical protein
MVINSGLERLLVRFWPRQRRPMVRIYISDGSYPGHLYALAAATGHHRWSFPMKDPIFSTPIAATGSISTGHVSALDTAASLDRHLSTQPAVVSSPVAVAGAVLALAVCMSCNYREQDHERSSTGRQESNLLARSPAERARLRRICHAIFGSTSLLCSGLLPEQRSPIDGALNGGREYSLRSATNARQKCPYQGQPYVPGRKESARIQAVGARRRTSEMDGPASPLCVLSVGTGESYVNRAGVLDGLLY